MAHHLAAAQVAAGQVVGPGHQQPAGHAGAQHQAGGFVFQRLQASLLAPQLVGQQRGAGRRLAEGGIVAGLHQRQAGALLGDARVQRRVHQFDHRLPRLHQVTRAHQQARDETGTAGAQHGVVGGPDHAGGV